MVLPMKVILKSQIYPGDDLVVEIRDVGTGVEITMRTDEQQTGRTFVASRSDWTRLCAATGAPSENADRRGRITRNPFG